VGALWFLMAVTVFIGVLDWLPYARRQYDAQLFSVAVGSLSGFFIAWCCIAIALWIRARRAR